MGVYLMTTHFKKIVAVFLLLMATGQPAVAALLYPDSNPAGQQKKLTASDWLTMIQKHIPPLQHERGQRWPLVLFAGVGYNLLSETDIRMLLARGITQHLEPSESAIPAAHALQKAGSPVILMTGEGGVWPYSLEKDKTQWAHFYPDELKVAPQWRDLPSPTQFKGWAIAAHNWRTILSRFREEKITVDAVWLDNENEPSQANYFAAILSPTTRALLPAKAVESEEAFRRYCRQLWLQLLSAYIAGPIREIFPKVSVTNWIATLSSSENPVLGWEGLVHPPMGPTLFTATNPVAYGIDSAFLAGWKNSFPLDQDPIDQFYTHVLLRQVSVDGENRQQMAPYLDAIPWVARWVVDHPDKRVPIMSRERYREVLRHIWLRGVQGMQVFNPSIFNGSNRVDMAIAEVQDAVTIYDEMLEYRNYLEKGTVINFHYPGVQENGPLWSGLRLKEEAIVRVFWQGAEIKPLKIEPWQGISVTLNSSTRAATFHLHLDTMRRKVEIVSIRR